MDILNIKSILFHFLSFFMGLNLPIIPFDFREFSYGNLFYLLYLQ